MRQSYIMMVVMITMLMDSTGGQYPDCVSCSDGSMPLSPLSYNTMRSNVFNGTQPSNKGCTNGAIVSGQVTIDCGQGTTLIDCDRGYNDSTNYSDLSNYFIWRGNKAIDQQVSIVFRFYQQIKISRITMFFWNSQSSNISVPNVRIFWGNYFDGSIILTNQITTITTNSPSRTGEGQRRMNIDVVDNGLQFQYLRIEMNFYGYSKWIFLSEVQFCGNTAPYHITQPSTDNDVQIVSPNATMTSITCSLNITIPFTVIIVWSHNGDIATHASNRNERQTGHSTTLLIENPRSSDAGIYQCTFNGIANNGWILKRNIILLITAIGPSIIHPPNDSQVVTFNSSSSSVQLMCSLNVTIPSSMTVTWSHNGTITSPNEVLTVGSTTTLVIRNPQPSDAGVYQCVFNDSVNEWMLRRNISVVTVVIDSSTGTIASTTDVTTAASTSTVTTTTASIITSSYTTFNSVITTSVTKITTTTITASIIDITKTTVADATIITTINTTDTYSSVTTTIALLISPTFSSSSSISDDNNSSSVGVTVAIVVLVVVVLITITVVVIGIIVVWKERKNKQHTKPEDVYYSTIDETTLQRTLKNRSEATHDEVDDKTLSKENPQYMDIVKSADSTRADKVVMQDNPSYSVPSDQVKMQDNPAYGSLSIK